MERVGQIEGLLDALDVQMSKPANERGFDTLRYSTYNSAIRNHRFSTIGGSH